MSAFAGEVHPLADLWPMLADDDLAALAASIAEHGLRDPLVVDKRGRLLDGRNRLAACRLAGVHPSYVTLPDLTTEELIAGFIQARNAERRHLTAGQQAMGRALMLHAQGKRKNGRWEYGALNSPILGNPGKTELNHLNKAGLVLDLVPDLAPDVMTGAISLDAAHQRAKAAQDVATAAEREAAAARELLTDLREHRPDLADLVDSSKLSLGDALDLRARDRAKAERLAQAKADQIRQQNLDLHIGYAALAQLKHDHIRAEVLAHYTPLADTITAAKLRELAALLTRIADEWTIDD